MRQLLKRYEGPPVDAEGHSFRYVHPDGHKSHGNDYRTWQRKILEHLEGNPKLPHPPGILALAEDQLCGNLPPHLCLYEEGDSPGIDARIEFGDVVSWVKTLARKLARGLSYVPKAEAERRAGICVSCPYNVTIMGGCGGGCKQLVEHLTPDMANLKTTQDMRLRSCGVCKCFNSIAVHFPLALLQEEDNASRQATYPAFCWKKRGGFNYKP